MSYTVIWPRPILDQLAEIYLQARAVGRGPLVTAAAEQIDIFLSANPEDVSESRRGPLRVLIVTPLTVGFRIDEPAQRVVIVHLHSHRPRGGRGRA